MKGVPESCCDHAVEQVDVGISLVLMCSEVDWQNDKVVLTTKAIVVEQAR